MIYTRIRGGLGNQLFQYSTARSLADLLNVPLGLDIREYDETSPYEMSLNHFNIRANLNPPGLIKHKKDGKLAYIFDRIKGNQKKVYKEPFLMFDKSLLSKVDGTYLKGYWQSEKYFLQNRENILNDINFIHKANELNTKNLKEIKKSTSISLHIRRGDYLSNKSYNSAHGVCNLSYYIDAVEYIKKHLGENIKVFAFSDDPDWVFENLKLSVEIKFINNNSSAKSFEDLRLMLNCDHNIIANSSFSWWGAWLNQNPEKIVISPKKWYSKEQLQNTDITPTSWLKF